MNLTQPVISHTASALFGTTVQDDRVFRRFGDWYSNGVKGYENAQTWYTPSHTASSSVRADSNAVWEGIGTGWFYSVLGGGSGLRPYGNPAAKVGLGSLGTNYFTTHRIDVREDNTNTTMGGVLRGDYAVPTLFDGNVDAITTKFDDQLIPGWAGYNNDFQLFSVTGQSEVLSHIHDDRLKELMVVGQCCEIVGT